MPSLKNFYWKAGVFLILYQIIFIIALPIYLFHFSPSKSLLISSFILFCFGGLSITGGYHRLFSHRAFKTHWIIESIILFFGSATLQGSALRWAYDHRKHHAFVDTDKDPYSINKGFWYAHFFWILEKPEPIQEKFVTDLINNPRTYFQHKNELFCMIGSNLLIFLTVGWFVNDFLGAFIIASLTRWFLQHHTTWFINSLAHTWGDKPFCQEHSAVNNFIISLLTFGEGYHNYHHTFANDYRNGVRWYQFDPTKWLIWSLNKIGLAWSLKRVDAITIQKKMVLERKSLLLSQLKSLWNDKKDDLEKKVHEISESLIKEIIKFKELKEKYELLCSKQYEKNVLKEIKLEINSLKENIRNQWKNWKQLSKMILNLKALSS